MTQKKKAIFLGDSITEGVGVSDEKNVYWRLVGDALGFEVEGYGVGGTRIAMQKQEINAGFSETFVERAKRMDKKADIVCVFGGTNDYGHGDAPIGNIDDESPSTFYGALNTLFSYLCEVYLDSYIFVMTPLHRLREDDPKGDGYNPPTLPLSGYVNAIREVAEKYSIPVLDLYKVSGMQPSVAPIQEKYMPDGLHPNDAGHKKMADIITKFLLTSTAI